MTVWPFADTHDQKTGLPKEPDGPVAEDTKSIAARLKEIQAEKARERAIQAEKEAIQVEDYYGC